MPNIFLRPIQPADDPIIATIIRNTLAEFGANHPGTVYFDDSTDHLSDIFKTAGSSYTIVELNEEIVGGAGIYPSDGLGNGVVELVKMYLLPQARNLGIGQRLIEAECQKARELGYSKVYIETMPELKKAVSLYERHGFNYLNGPLGNTGHFGCDIWMLKDLNQSSTSL
jgi:putative acetyltransferase